MKTVLLDTSILIDYLRIKTNKKKTILYFLAESENILTVSVLTFAELYSGENVWINEVAKQELEALFSNITILPFDENIAKRAGGLRAFYKIELIDAIIAATAITNCVQLVTLNTKDFIKIKELDLFQKNF